MDEIERQLRRYADAAEARVPADPEVPHRRRSWRPLLATAAVVALVGGPLAVFLTGRGVGDRIDTTPAEPTPTSLQLPHHCPTPDDAPRPDQMQMALPWAARVQVIEDSVHGPDVHHLLIRPGEDDSIEVEVHADPPLLTDRLPRGSRKLAAHVCDPFAHDGPSPIAVTATLSTTPADNRNLTVVMERWVIILRAKPERTSSVTADDLLAVVAGMSWPAGTDEATDATAGGEPCADDPEVALEVGSFTLTAVPDGFEPVLPVEETDTGPVDMGGESTATLSLIRPGGGSIQVTSFGAESPSRYITRFLDGSAIDHVNVRRCVRTEEGWQRLDNLAQLGASGGATMLAAQEWEYEGYLVTGAQVTREELVTVAEGLRFGPP